MSRRARPPRAILRPRWWLALALAVASSAGCVHLRGTTEQPAVLHFRVDGVRSVNASDLVAHLATQESEHSPPIPIVGPLLHQMAGAREELGKLEAPPPVPIVGPLVYAIRGSRKSAMVAPLDRDQLEVDLQRVVAYYRDHGYYAARVAEHEVVPVGEGQVDVHLRVEEGPPVRVTRVEIVGLEDVPEARAALAHPALKDGDVFTVAAYDALRAQLEAALHDHGWALGEVAQEAQVLPEERTATVRYQVTPGQRFRFGPLFVAGTGSVPRELVRRRAGEDVKPGDWYAEDKLAQAQARVYAMAVFSGVRVSPGKPDAGRGIIPVLVSVREAPFRTVRIGPSAGILSSSRVDLSGLVGWTHRNFLGDLRKLDLTLTAGYAWLLSEKHSGPVGKLTADFTQPRILTDRVDLTVRAEGERGLEQGYDFYVERFRPSLPVRITPRITFVPSYNLEVYQLFNVASTFNPNDPTQQTPVLVSCRHDICLLSYLEQRLDLDLRNDPLNTHRGAFLSFAVQEGGNVGGFGYQYFRFLPEARAYLPLGPRVVLAGRARIGAFVPVGESADPPTVALFESGGPNSMRGYGLNRLSPMQCVRNSDGKTCSSAFVPVGGNGLAEYTLELRFPLGGPVFGAAFTDAGYVSYPSASPDAWRYALDPRRLQWAAGLGIRYRTPIGPVRLDLASRIPWSAPVPRNSPTVPATHREPGMALQLSVGEAF